MNNNLENNDWKTEAPLLGSLPVHHPFSIPEGYFDDLTNNILSSVYLDRLKTGVKESGFTVPKSYFNELNESINFAIVTEKIKSAIPNEGHTVPANYFEQLHSNILNGTVRKTNDLGQTKIVRLWHSSLLKYVSAACLLILSASGFYFYQQHNADQQIAYNDLTTEQMLYDIDEEVIIDHIEANGLQQVSQSATETELENYILSNYTQNDIASDL